MRLAGGADSVVRQSPPSPVAPPGFVLEGSNGYGLAFYALEARDRSEAQGLLLVDRKGRSATYVGPATVTSDSLDMDLGALGHISVTFHPTGGTRGLKCGSERPVPIAAGYYEGSIDFHGEEGYTDVEATRARGDASILRLLCAGTAGGSGGRGPGVPGAELRVAPRRNRASGPSLTVIENDPHAPVQLEVNASERRGDISIDRSLRMNAPRTAFQYDARLRTATLHPPQPFSGRASFRRTGRHAARWTGSLAVDLPGRSDVRLTGGGLRAHLFRARFKGAAPLEANRPGRAALDVERARLSLPPPG